MDRKTTTGARAINLVFGLVLVCCTVFLPGFDDQAVSSAAEVRRAPRASEVSIQPGAASANTGISYAAQVSGTLALTNTFQLFLPVLRGPDQYADWTALGQPA